MRYLLIGLALLVLILAMVNRSKGPPDPQTPVEVGDAGPTRITARESSPAQSSIAQTWRAASSSKASHEQPTTGISSPSVPAEEVNREINLSVVQTRDLQFQGYGTPEKALQSTLSAMRSGNLERFLESLTQSGRETLGRELAGKTREEAVSMIMDQVKHLEALDPGRQRLDEQGNVVFILNSTERQNALHTSREEEILRFAPENGQWKYSP
jgi:hypothetical protein